MVQNIWFKRLYYSIIFLFLCSSKVFSQASEILAGAWSINITPPFAYPHYRGESTGVHDSLYAKALVIKQGEITVAIVICDLLWVERGLSSSARLQISEKTGIPYSNIIIAGTHTHTGPAYHPNIRELTGTLRPPFDEDKPSAVKDPYSDNLAMKIASSVNLAHKSLEKVQIETGAGQANGISFNRRFIMKDGRAVFNPGVGNKDAILPAGPVDPEVGILMLRKVSDNSPIAILSNFGVHADTFGGSTFSSDYPGTLAQALNSAIGGGYVSIFATGPCGDLNHVDVHGDKAKRLSTKDIGVHLSNAIIKEIPTLKKERTSFLSMRSQFVYAPLQEYTSAELTWANNESAKPLHNESAFLERRRRLKIRSLERLRRTEAIAPTVEREGWKLPLEVQVIGIGKDLAIVGLPGEVFVELGLAIKKSSPFRTTLIIELTNSHIAYVPTRKAFSQGSYETINSRLAPGGGEMMVEAAINMLDEIKGEVH
ncbi:MAG: neutral/alkaline non-lysosomal ceramidase N-terminal domain-containing protein [Daejeonella sp.]|uniref:neutral/alkaline non-lysosomal ceramidase N-terminal domain-containing protein n=1 Tax=Daejeonella sp. TaxID=2805397 RepID=UPI003C707749